jgi:HEAT repeat protein
MAKHQLLRFVCLVAVFPSGLAASSLPAEETAEDLFRKAVESSGERYVETRTALLARPLEVAPTVDEALKSARDWRTRLAAEAIRGWVRCPDLYLELWTWQAHENRYRNPYPRMAAEAKEKFTAAGKDAIPLMLELVWKKHETHYGALPQLLSEWNVELAIPVLVEQMTASESGTDWGLAEAVGRFGERSTPHLLAALRDATPSARAQLVASLGFGGDLKAVDELRNRLKEDPDETVREHAARALAALKQYAILRQDLPDLQSTTQVQVVRVLGDDKSDDTRESLRRLATMEEPASLRMEVVRALVNQATAADLAAACEIARQESDDTIKSSMYVYLGMSGRYQKNQLVRKLFLESLQDPVEGVRVRAIEGLQCYDDPEVTRALLSLLSAKDITKRTALWVLKERQHPAIVDDVLPLLHDQEVVVRQFAAEALGRNPAQKALEPLISVLDDQDMQVRRLAVEAITAIGGDRALSALTQALPAEKDNMVKDRMTSGIRFLSAARPEKSGTGQ